MPLDVRLNWAGMFTCEPDWTWDTAITPLRDFDLWAVHEGHAVMEMPQGTLHLGPGDCLVLRPRHAYRCRTAAEEPLVVHVAHYDHVDERRNVVEPPPEQLPPLHRPLLDATFFRPLTARIARSHQAGRTHEADAWLRAALLEVERQDREHAEAESVDERVRLIDQACAAIAHEPGRTWWVSELAASCYMSADHFTRLFKEARGITPREFIIRHRIDAARRLLLSSSHTVGRIAKLTGFADIYHFSRQFKARTGRSPTKFRRGG